MAAKGKYTPSLHPHSQRTGEFIETLDAPKWLTAVSDQLIERATGRPDAGRPHGHTGKVKASGNPPRSSPHEPRVPHASARLEPRRSTAKPAAAADQIRAATTSAEAHDLLAGLRNSELRAIATGLGVRVPARGTTTDLRRIIAASRHPARAPDDNIRPVLANARTVPHINRAVAAEAKRITGHGTHVDLTGSDPQLAREHGEGVLRALEHAPHTRVTAIYTYGTGGARKAVLGDDSGEYANARGNGGTSIGFAMRWVSDPAAYRESLARDFERLGSGARGSVQSGPIGVAIHEVGHVATDQAPWDNVADRPPDRQAVEHAQAMAERVTGHRHYSQTGREFIAGQVSHYAATEPGELTAEAFADVVLNGDRASQLSHEIYAMVTGRRGRQRSLSRVGRPAAAASRPAARAAPAVRVLNLDGATDGQLLAEFHRISRQPPGTPGVDEALTAIDAELARREGSRHLTVTDASPETRMVDDLVARGWSYVDAYAEAHNLDGTKLEREQRMQLVDAERRPGERRIQTIRRLYYEQVAVAHLQAEADTRGNLLNRAGRAAGIDPATLWSGPAARARKYASDELKAWWEAHGGRVTVAEFTAQFTGDRAAAEKARMAGQGRDFGI